MVSCRYIFGNTSRKGLTLPRNFEIIVNTVVFSVVVFF